MRDSHRKPKLKSILGLKGSRRISDNWKSEVLHKQKRGIINKNKRIVINEVNMSEGSQSGSVKGSEKRLKFIGILVRKTGV